MSRFTETQQAYNDNDPPIEVNQIWSAPNEKGECLRRIRILAPHPDTLDGNRLWITCDVPGGLMKFDYHSPRVCPEFNLRYVFELEQ